MARCRFAVASLVLALVLALGLPPAAKAVPQTFQVSSTADSGPYTLRAAIMEANTNEGADTITFAIGSCAPGICTISLASDLPALTDPAGVTINGYTQSYAAEAHDNTPAVLKIVIDGNGYDCLTLESANNVVKGLDIRDCNCGVTIQTTDASDNVVTGNHIGVGGANVNGVWITSGAHGNTIGGDTAAERNVISHNNVYGVRIEHATTYGNTVSGNYIGTGLGGQIDVGNGYSGVQILEAHDNTIGGDMAGEPNVIAGNGHHGVYIRGVNANGNVVEGNVIGAAEDTLAGVPNDQDGVRIAEGAYGNTIGGDTVAERNVILANTGSGVRIDGGTTHGNVVSGNQIGVTTGDVSGLGNDDGVWISGGAYDNTIGGDTAGERNLISGNGGCGVLIEHNGTSGNTVSGNYIGTDTLGGRAPDDLGNGEDGVLIRDQASQNTVGGATAGERNVIADNTWSGVSIYGSGTVSNTVIGNVIGLDATGTLTQGNTLIGVYIGWGAAGNVVGGDTAAERNVISGNEGDGVQIQHAGTEGNVVSGNIIGLLSDGSTEMPNGGDGVRIFEGACLNRIGGTTVAERNLISGNGLSGVSLYGNTTMTNTVSGNYIGTNAGGTADRGNTLFGVYIGSGADHNVVGGAAAGERNVISGNDQGGVRIEHSATDYNRILGNYIGTTAAGTVALPNAWEGVHIAAGARYNTIGGSTAGEGNLISGNDGNGVQVQGSGTQANVISGNLIGTSADGASGLGNTSDGVVLAGGTHDNQVGGATAVERNVISGNFAGITLRDNDTAYNDITGNYIGLSAAGTVAVPNTYVGIYMGTGVHDNTVGGATPGERNVISGNTQHGVYIFHGDGNTVTGNYIGTDASGSAALGNGSHGVDVYGDADDNVIGPGNLIAYNTLNGVQVYGITADRNRITRNSIHTNSQLGIDLVNAANENIAPPVITGLTSSWPFAISGTACDGCTVEVFASATDDGQGEVWLGTETATGGAFTLYVPAIPRPYLTATATDATKGTSEFSAVYDGAHRLYLPLVLRNS